MVYRRHLERDRRSGCDHAHPCRPRHRLGDDQASSAASARDLDVGAHVSRPVLAQHWPGHAAVVAPEGNLSAIAARCGSPVRHVRPVTPVGRGADRARPRLPFRRREADVPISRRPADVPGRDRPEDARPVRRVRGRHAGTDPCDPPICRLVTPTDRRRRTRRWESRSTSPAGRNRAVLGRFRYGTSRCPRLRGAVRVCHSS